MFLSVLQYQSSGLVSVQLLDPACPAVFRMQYRAGMSDQPLFCVTKWTAVSVVLTGTRACCQEIAPSSESKTTPRSPTVNKRWPARVTASKTESLARPLIKAGRSSTSGVAPLTCPEYVTASMTSKLVIKRTEDAGEFTLLEQSLAGL